MGLIRRKSLRYSGIARSLAEALPDFREEVNDALKRFDNLDFGFITNQDLADNTKNLANEGGMLWGCYPSDFGITHIIHNLDLGNTTVVLSEMSTSCGHFGF